MSPAVTTAEANLLTIARVAVGAHPAQDALRLLLGTASAPKKLGPSARAVLGDTLARGTVVALARRGGWVKEGGRRLWERHEMPSLHFSANLVRVFRWLLSSPLAGEVPALVVDGEFTWGEQVVLVTLLEQLRAAGCEGPLVLQAPVRRAPLVVLAHVVDLARAGPLEAVPAFDVPHMAVLVEGLRDVLARAWVDGERLKRDQERPETLLDMGRAQAAVLDAFLTAVDAAGQRALATFLVDAAARWLATPRTAEDYGRGLASSTPLRDRSEARRHATHFLRALDRLHAWDREHRAVRFIDDGYEIAQRLVKDWERLGERGFTDAARLVAELDSLPG
jgi:hypothetical protein